MNAKKKKRSHLIAKVSKGTGAPAVWLTHTLWISGLKSGALRGYLDQRRYTGQRRARVLLGRPALGDEWHFDKSNAEAAFDFFCIGFEAHDRRHLLTDPDLAGCTPARAVELGDREEAKGMAHELARLAGHPNIFDWRAAA